MYPFLTDSWYVDIKYFKSSGFPSKGSMSTGPIQGKNLIISKRASYSGCISWPDSPNLMKVYRVSAF